MTVRELFDRWVETAAISAQSRKRRRRAFRNALLPHVADLQTADVTPDRILEIQHAVIDAAGVRLARFALYGCLAAPLRDAARDGLIPSNPFPSPLRWPDGAWDSPLVERIQQLPGGHMETLSESITVKQYADHWLKTWLVPPYVRPYVATQMARNLELYILPAIGHLKMTAVSPVHLRQLQADLYRRPVQHTTARLKHQLERAGEVVQGRTMKPSSVRQLMLTLVGGMFHAAMRDGVVQSLPQKALRWPRRRGEMEPDPYTAEERDKILTWFEKTEPWNLMIPALVFLAGLRPSEACGLKWGDWKPEPMELMIERAATHGIVGETKTESSKRLIQVCPRLADIIERLHPSWVTADDWIATNRKGGTVDSRNFGKQQFLRACSVVAVRYRGLYEARATSISESLMEGSSITRVAKYHGTSSAMIERHYFKWTGAIPAPGSGEALPPTDDSAAAIKRPPLRALRLVKSGRGRRWS